MSAVVAMGLIPNKHYFLSLWHGHKIKPIEKVSKFNSNTSTKFVCRLVLCTCIKFGFLEEKIKPVPAKDMVPLVLSMLVFGA